MEKGQWEICRDETFAEGTRKCSDFKAVDSDVFYTNDNRKVYFVKTNFTMEFSDYLRGQEHSFVKTFGLIYDGKGSWALVAESYEQVADDHYDKIIHMMKSFSIKEVTLESVVIPDWIKSTAGWWCNNEIEDSSFIEALQYLIKNDVIVISAVPGDTSTNEVPSWVKNNACWWSDGQIDDNTFATGIKYLIENGIVVV
tara:strand:- start:45 stop:638 length:594 start_codon:yes stop_codon:yes gene_type:complete